LEKQTSLLKKGIIPPSPKRQPKKYSITEVTTGIAVSISTLLPSNLYHRRDKP
jgi:hypothetical protein